MSTVEIYQDTGGEYRWRKKAANGEIVSDSGESYTRRSDAREAAQREHPDVPIVETPHDLKSE